MRTLEDMEFTSRRAVISRHCLRSRRCWRKAALCVLVAPYAANGRRLRLGHAASGEGDNFGDVDLYFSQPRVCPPLFLAPMEGLGERPFRCALAATIGGFDEACTSFIRLPGVLPATPALMVKSAQRMCAAAYDKNELALHGVSLAAQLMSSQPSYLAAATAHLAGVLGARRVDLNCGCPANAVTGRGAGSSLLKDAELLHACVSAMAAAAAPHGAVVSVKLRAGFDDASSLPANVDACVHAGARVLTLHPRTRLQGYSGAAEWAHIAATVARARVPVIGNGDVTTAEAAVRLVATTGCSGVMVGRGAAADPLIFARIRSAFGAAPRVDPEGESALVEAFLRRFYDELGVEDDGPRLPRLKQLCVYLLRGSAALPSLLRRPPGSCSASFLEDVVGEVRATWRGPPAPAPPVNTFSRRDSDERAAGPTRELAAARTS